MISKATEYAFKNGAECVESYPIQAKKGKMPDVFAYVGIKTAFEKSGFETIKQASETRFIMRKTE